MVIKKANVRKSSQIDSILQRIADLESYQSDNAAHIADLESRIHYIKATLIEGVSQRVSDLESQTCDLDAHLADVETRLVDLKNRVKRPSE